VTALFPPPAPKSAPRTFRESIDQGKWWKSNEGWIKIKDMTPGHRINAARMLLRAAKNIEASYSMSSLYLYVDAPDDVVDSLLDADNRRAANPEAWLRDTRLYRKLTKGLAVDARVEDQS
jgi:hypothetical protein